VAGCTRQSLRTTDSRRNPPPSAAVPAGLRAVGSGSWWLAAGGIIAFGLLSQVLILWTGWRTNPLARVPLSDANVYWTWAGEIARGRFLDDTPFMSAPLYPYLLGTLRAAGGGLVAVYVVQAALHVLTVAMLAWVVGRRFGRSAGLVAAAVYVLLTEPGYYTGRILACTVQLLLVVLLWAAMLSAQTHARWNRWLMVGVLVGLNCLANPPMLLGVVLACAWAWWQSRGRRGVLYAALTLASAAVVIAPATLHNYVVSGEFIPISAQAGITFAQGNAPGATGTYTPLPNIPPARELQNEGAMRQYRRATGGPPSWTGVNRFFLRQGLEYWRTRPHEALVLLGRKFYWFVSGRVRSDIYMPALEVESGHAGWLRLAPLPTAWVVLPGLVALLALSRRARTYGPELILGIVPLLVVLGFFYTPRYRLPAVPVLAALSAWALVRAVQASSWRRWGPVTGLAVVTGVATGPLNRAIGFDGPDKLRAHYWLATGLAWAQGGRLPDAERAFRLAAELNPSLAQVPAKLCDVLMQQGRLDEALRQASRAAELDPRDASLRALVGHVLVRKGEIDTAIEQYRAALALEPELPAANLNLGSLLWERGQMEEGIALLRRAYDSAPDDLLVCNALAWCLATTPDLPASDRAVALDLAQRAASAAASPSVSVLDTLAAALAANGQLAEAVATAERALVMAEGAKDAVRAAEFRARLELYRRGQPYVAQRGGH